MDVVRQDLQTVGVREDAEDRERRRRMIRCGDSNKKLDKAKKGRFV